MGVSGLNGALTCVIYKPFHLVTVAGEKEIKRLSIRLKINFS